MPISAVKPRVSVHESSPQRYIHVCLESWFDESPNGGCYIKRHIGALCGEMLILAAKTLNIQLV